uniref:Uncharacterized protein n=1 Tax=Lotus japonicus TaxID=34305 RepID=I3T9D3_LOTJA|nr:unknown [Lotus japonicus]
MCKATQFVSISIMSVVLACCGYCKNLRSKFRCSVSSICSGTESSRPGPKMDLRCFVLHLEGEEELVGVMLKNNRDATNHWVQQGEKKEPKLVIELLKKCTLLQGFKGVGTFDSDQVPSLQGVEAPYSWSLPLVTLASIVVALPNIDRGSVRKLISTLNQGLPYVKFIEDNIDKERRLSKLRLQQKLCGLGVDLYDKWLDVDLCKLSIQDQSPKETLERLVEAAKTRCEKFKAKYHHICMKLSPSQWPIKLLASNSMYRISKTTLLNHKIIEDSNSERLFEELTVMISDILGACLCNLPHVISTKCLNSAIEEREDSVRYAVYILGKTKKIIEMLEKRAFPNVDFCRGTYIEDWRLMHKQCSFLPFDPSSMEESDCFTQKAPHKSNDLCLNID